MLSFLKTHVFVDDTWVKCGCLFTKDKQAGTMLTTPKVMCVFMDSFHKCLLSTYVYKAF